MSFVSDIFGGGGGSNVTTNVTPAAATPEETKLLALSAEEKEIQLANLKQITELQKKYFPLAESQLDYQSAIDAEMRKSLTPEQYALQAKTDFERSQRLGTTQEELLNLQLEQLRRGGAATPEQIARINESTQAGIAAGSADIDTAVEEGLDLLREELAPSLGLRSTDSPIIDRGGTIVKEGLRQKGSLQKNLQAVGATAKLNYPLAVQQLIGTQGQGQQVLVESIKNFQRDLEQKAFQNRLSLTGQVSNTGLGLAGVGSGASGGVGLYNSRYANAGRTSTTANEASALDNMTGLGRLLSGAGAAYTAFSDRRLKRNITRIGELLNGISIYLFQYLSHAPLYIGAMADEVQKIIPDAVKTGRFGFKSVDYAMVNANA